jgi:hypothetical protein
MKGTGVEEAVLFISGDGLLLLRPSLAQLLLTFDSDQQWAVLSP